MKQTFILDLDDFSPTTKLEKLFWLKEHFPDFKVTMFTIPFSMDVISGNVKIDKLKEWAKIVRDIDWIEICVHGLVHHPEECETSYKAMKKLLTGSERVLKKLKLPYKKIFKAPHWKISEEAMKAVRDMGYILAVDRNNIPTKMDGLKTYVYDWSIEEPIPNKKIVKGHGHVNGTIGNNINFCFEKLMHLPVDAKFQTISEYLDEHPNRD